MLEDMTMSRKLVLHTDPFNVVNRFFNDELYRPLTREWVNAWGLGSRLPIDIYQDGEGYTFVALAPGLNAEELTIEAHNNVLRIAGETIAPSLSTQENVVALRSEIGYGKFNRSFELPEDIDAEKIEARLEKGLLVVRVPKAETAKPRSIKVQAK
jgi:HSP20 family protein